MGKQLSLQTPHLGHKRNSGEKRAEEENLTSQLLDDSSESQNKISSVKKKMKMVDPIYEDEDENKISPPKVPFDKAGGEPLRLDKKGQQIDHLMRSTLTSMQKVQSLFDKVESEMEPQGLVIAPE